MRSIYLKIKAFFDDRAKRKLIRKILNETAAMWMAYENNPQLDRSLQIGGESEFMIFARKVAIFRYSAGGIFPEQYGITDPVMIDAMVVTVISKCSGEPRSTVELAMLTAELPGTR